MGIGPMELIVILMVALLVLGPAKVLDVGRGLGRLTRQWRHLTSDVTQILEEDDTAPPKPPTTPKAGDSETRGTREG